MPEHSGSRLISVQFVALALTWGASFLCIKIALEGMNPTQVMLGRLLFGALVLTAVMLISRRPWPRGWKIWRSLLVIVVFLAVIPYTLYAWAGQHIPSALSSIYNATAPIATMVITLMILPEEKLNRSRTVGLILGAFGVVVLAAPWNMSFDGSEADILLAQLACLGANVCFAISFVLQRKLLRGGTHDPTSIAASQIVLSAGLGLILAPVIGGFEPVQLSPEVLLNIVLLGALGTGVAYIWLNNIIAAWGSTRASTVTYVTPVVGVVLGAVVLGEVLHWNEPVGGVIILLGVLFSQGLLRSQR